MSLKAALAVLAQERAKVEIEHPMLPGQKLWIQELTGTERDEWEMLVARKTKAGSCTDPGAIRAKLVQLCLVESNGERVYSPDELSLVNGLPGTFREDLFETAIEHNRLSKEAEEAQLKNSASEAGNDSESASHMSLESRVSTECLS